MHKKKVRGASAARKSDELNESVTDIVCVRDDVACVYVCPRRVGNEQQLGDKQSYPLHKLLKAKQTYKGLVVPGGKADMMFTATNFGDEEAEEEDDAFMDFL